MLQARPDIRANLLCVAPHLVDDIWPLAVDLIESALIRSESDLSVEAIKAKIDADKSYLWIVWSFGRRQLLAALTTELVKLENGRKLCVIGTCGGKDMDTWIHLLPEMEGYARMEGCDALRFYGRKGWVRYYRSRGYTQPWVVMEKDIT
jgi:hypothetical protein